MNRFAALALAAALIDANAAHATFICGAPIQTVGAATGTNPVVVTAVGVNPNTKAWWADHKLADGTLIHRGDQYVMNAMDKPGEFGWWGYLNKNPNLVMRGDVVSLDNGQFNSVRYSETLFDKGHGGAVVMHSDATCVVDRSETPTVQPAPVAVQPAPAPIVVQPAPVVIQSAAPQPLAPGQSVVIALVSSDSGFSETVPVGMGGQTVMMTIDTGAMIGMVPKSVADALIASGNAVEEQAGTSILADGQKVPERRITIKQISLGSQVVNNVLTGVGPDNGAALLGMSVLKKFGRFTIDTATDHLILG
jgi:gag-polyprotein putative aspartyl protease